MPDDFFFVVFHENSALFSTVQDATVNSLCEKVRGIPTMKKYRDSVTVHCDLKGLKETNITTVVAFVSTRLSDRLLP